MKLARAAWYVALLVGATPAVVQAQGFELNEIGNYLGIVGRRRFQEFSKCALSRDCCGYGRGWLGGVTHLGYCKPSSPIGQHKSDGNSR